MKRISSLYWMGLGELILFALIVSGVLPRSAAWVLAGGLLGYAVWGTLERVVLLFTLSIPIFIALPITSSFDNFNTWRLLSLAILVRWLIEPATRTALAASFHALWHRPRQWILRHPFIVGSALLLLIAGASLVSAPYPAIGIKRIIYFTNLAWVPLVVWWLCRSKRLMLQEVVRAISIGAMIAISVGYLQLLSTYLMDIYAFMRIWGEGIQLRQFGSEWSHIAVWVGNTWFAYYGNQLSLRVFSLFPDSHSFPSFVLLSVPALLAIALGPVIARAHDTTRALARVRARLSILWVPAAFLMMILSGTRGIWAGAVGTLFLAVGGLFAITRSTIDAVRRRIATHVASYLALFFLLFAIAWPIFISPQFLLGKGDWGMFGSRIKSIVDFGETSNSQRIAIWKASLVSIGKHPLLGIGIGNFPVVLDQNIALARAGSTAHNLYLHVAAEMGIPAMLIVCGIIGWSWILTIRWFRRASDDIIAYPAMLLLVLPWFFAYVLTDPILFDERIFLLWGITTALIAASTDAS